MQDLKEMLGRYILPVERDDWMDLLANWEELLPIGASPWLLSRFGELFVCQTDQRIGALQVSAFQYGVVAESKTDFSEWLADSDKMAEWFLAPLVDRLVSAGRILEVGRCYSFITPLALGGKFEMENVMMIPIREHFRCMGEVFQQVKDLPDGSKVILTTKSGKESTSGDK